MRYWGLLGLVAVLLVGQLNGGHVVEGQVGGLNEFQLKFGEKSQKAHQELISTAKLNHDALVADVAKYRSPVFVKDNSQMKHTAADKDQYEYVPGSTVGQQMRDYEFIQAPLNEKTALDLSPTCFEGRVGGLSEFQLKFGKMSAEKKQAQQQRISCTKLNHDTVVANAAKYRSPVFVKDNKPMKLKNTAAGKDQYEYVPGSIVDQQMRDYAFIQAPLNEKTALDLWRTVWQDPTRLVCSVSQEKLIGEETSSKCWPYRPRSEDKSISYDNGRFVVKCKKKGGERKKGFTICELIVVGPPDEDKKGEEKGGGADTEGRPVTLLHFEKWAPEKWMDGENVFHLVMELHNRTQQPCDKVTDRYSAPVLLQDYELCWSRFTNASPSATIGIVIFLMLFNFFEWIFGDAAVHARTVQLHGAVAAPPLKAAAPHPNRGGRPTIFNDLGICKECEEGPQPVSNRYSVPACTKCDHKFSGMLLKEFDGCKCRGGVRKCGFCVFQSWCEKGFSRPEATPE
ncbi:unnamed protein product, partial [Mesorhabditis spiculigera]